MNETWPMRLIDAPVGLLQHDGTIILKTEYMTRHSDGSVTPDCYIVNSGEYFWGGTSTPQERNNLKVTPAHPAHIDLEAWDCEYCTGDVDDRPFLDSKDLYISGDGWLTSDYQDHDFCKIQFCPKCGRPLTPEARAMLEKRLRRVKTWQ